MRASFGPPLASKLFLRLPCFLFLRSSCHTFLHCLPIPRVSYPFESGADTCGVQCPVLQGICVPYLSAPAAALAYLISYFISSWTFCMYTVRGIIIQIRFLSPSSAVARLQATRGRTCLAALRLSLDLFTTLGHRFPVIPHFPIMSRSCCQHHQT